MRRAALTHRRVLAVAGPIVLSNVTVPILGLVDTGVIGQLGDAVPIGAVGIGAVILSTFFWVFGFLRMGTTGLTAQAHGAGQHGEVAAMLTRALLIAVLAGISLIALQGPLFWAAFQIAPASGEVEVLAREYLAIRIWGAPFAISVYAFTGWLIALERARSVLVLQVVMNGVNIGLDLWFVLGLGWGVEGVAIATLLAEFSGAALGLWLCRDIFHNPAWRDRARVLDGPTLKNMAVVNTDILLRSLFIMAIFTSFTFYGSGLSDTELAANQVLMQFIHVTAYALDGFAFGASTFVGQALGVGDRALLRRASMMTSVWAATISGVLAFGFLLLGGWGIDVMTTAPDVRQVAKGFLPYMVLAPLLAWPAWMFDGIFTGATRTADMRNLAFVSAVIYFAAVYALMPGLGNHGLWAALLISFVARGATLALRYPALERSAT
ncbi:multidrug resistance protein, MATE family [Aliiroseovarius halocynthiae]|uniref:MATE family efflux transporter n=1 Tax=Aliiroseovarius halocynthiae TaxID=985055 RepID=A0A545SR40_9RHOB|nr:MATE family efflux transporter [Aliiroseovarius halocynthiae]TQV67443.1 MATE family efflux transporter [Aliiroseovarius halocynthiae]SMR81450.1 multidrug resistance protein, MATE family [Aliiroseovarius halocynthiae]